MSDINEFLFDSLTSDLFEMQLLKAIIVKQKVIICMIIKDRRREKTYTGQRFIKVGKEGNTS